MKTVNLGKRLNGITFDSKGGVYKITNLITGDFYVGSTVNFKRRLANHKSPCTHSFYDNRRLYQEIYEYGRENFEFEVLECCTENLVECEQKWISELKPTYNTRSAKMDKENAKKLACERELKWQNDHKDQYDTRLREYYRRTCEYEGHEISFNSLVYKFRKMGVAHPTTEANKYVKETE